MRAEVRRFLSPDADDLLSYVPQVADDLSLLFQVFVGPVGERGEESFDITVCTPKWLSRAALSGPVFGTHLLVVSHSISTK